MPIKEFNCTACGHKFEEILGINDPNPDTCPKCGKKELKRVLGTFRIVGGRSKSASSAEELKDQEFGPALEGGDFGEDAGMDGGMDYGEGGDLGDGEAPGPEGGDFSDEEE